MKQQAILTVPWFVLEDTALEPVVTELDLVDVCAPAMEPPARSGSYRVFMVAIAISIAWVFCGSGLFVIDLVMDAGGMLAYVAVMGVLFCGAFLALTYPREDEHESFLTLGNEATAYGQCTPSRGSMLTGGNSHD